MSQTEVKEYFLKRALDFSLAFIGMVISSPLWLITIIAILADDGDSIFFLQERCGRYGRLFKAIKFRTMKAVRNSRGHRIIDIDKDPRVTRVGKILRATAMDELPVLLNILTGRMSFVGPRPLPYEIEDEDKARYSTIDKVPGYELRRQLRPGLTGYAQIYAPKKLNHQDKFSYDNIYIEKMSLWFDIKLIVLSFWISLSGNWGHTGKKL